MKQIAIIGGGASGIMAAIIAARNGGTVTIYEKNNRIGKKILATGNGKCNFSNRYFSYEAYYCKDEHSNRKALLEGVFGQHNVEDTEVFFQELGLCIREKNGNLYPVSEQASTILELLRNELERLQVSVHTDTEITSLKKISKQYQVVIVACGSNANASINGRTNGYDLAKEIGHTLQKQLPSLVALRSTTTYNKAVAGVRTQAILSLQIGGELVRVEEGELQLTDYGLSGIAIFQLSRDASIALDNKQSVSVLINFLPYIKSGELESFVERRYETHKNQTIEEFFLGMLHQKLILPLLKELHIPFREKVKNYSLQKVLEVLQTLQRFEVKIHGTNPYEKAQVSSGGVLLEELNKNLRSKLCQNIYFIGEMVDVDGICGGYNLQWAWTSGYVAGKDASLPL
ncbi:MAG: aminoacetone oxidase family FAD-binding enzyme [Eubacteriales bacterium]